MKHLVNGRLISGDRLDGAAIAGVSVVGLQGQVVVTDEYCGYSVVEPQDGPILFVQFNELWMKLLRYVILELEVRLWSNYGVKSINFTP